MEARGGGEVNAADTKTLRTLIEDHQRIDTLLGLLQRLFGDTFEGEFFTRMFGTLDNYTDTVAEFLGDEFGWISWFIYECDCGKKPMGCDLGDGNGERTIATVEDLIKLLDDEKEAGK